MKSSQTSAVLIVLLSITAAEESSIRGGGGVHDVVVVDEQRNFMSDRVSRILSLFQKQPRRMEKKEDYNAVFDQEYEQRNANIDPALLYFPKFIPVFELDPPTQSPAPSTQGPTITSSLAPSVAATPSPTRLSTAAPTPGIAISTPSPTSFTATFAPVAPTVSPKPTLTNAPTSLVLPTTPPLIATSAPTPRATFASFTASPGVGAATTAPGSTPAPSTSSLSTATSAPTIPSVSAATLAPTVGGSPSSSTNGSMSLVRTPAPTVIASSLWPTSTAVPTLVASADDESSQPPSGVPSFLPTPLSSVTNSDEPTLDDATSQVPSSIPTLDTEQRLGLLSFESFLLGGKSSYPDEKEEFWSTLFVRKREEDAPESP